MREKKPWAWCLINQSNPGSKIARPIQPFLFYMHWLQMEIY
jgi:hypothetical protein